MGAGIEEVHQMTELEKELQKLRASKQIPERQQPQATSEQMHFSSDEEMQAAERRQGLIRAEDLSKILGISVRRVQQLRADGALVTKKSEFGIRYDAMKSFTALAKYLLAKQDTASQKERAVRADADYKEKKAALMEIELRKRRLQVHEARHVRELMTGYALAIKAAFLAIPGRIAIQLYQCRNEAECASIVRTSICEALQELSEFKYDPEKFRKLIELEGDSYDEDNENRNDEKNNEKDPGKQKN